MPLKRPPECIEDAFQLYLQYNGQHFDLIEKEMQAKGWAGWRKQILFSRKLKNGDIQEGWIAKYGWEKALQLHIANKLRTNATNAAESLFLDIKQKRETISTKLDADGCNNKDLVYQHRDYCKLEIDALMKLESARENIEGFAAFFDRLLEWLPSLSDNATKELIKIHEPLFEKARAHYANVNSKES